MTPVAIDRAGGAAPGSSTSAAGAGAGLGEAGGLSITQISSTDCRGGAAKAAYRLHRALAGVVGRSRMFVAQRFGSDLEVIEHNPARPGPVALGRMLFQIGRRLNHVPQDKTFAYFSSDRAPTGRRFASQLPPSDLINLHWVADMMDYRALPALAERAPLVWTFHDMNAFTGGCHYTGGCERFLGRCGTCPQLEKAGESDLSRRVLERKSRIFAEIAPERLALVCPSRWLAGEVGRSAVCRRFDVRVIPNGIDLEEFSPLERAEARRRLDLPPEAKIVLFVADSITDQRKGLALILAAVQRLRRVPGLAFVALGRGRIPAPDGVAIRQIGPWEDSANLRLAYSAADVFAIPSQQDNLPNTVLEAMACGTPVVGFSIGGIAEAVVDGRTGLLVPPGDVDALAAGLRQVLEDAAWQRSLAAESRARAEREYSSRLQALRYAALYGELAAAGAGRKARAAGSGR
jgi:glycosyltransferase involved in cell wall biosynthesis